MGRCSSLCWLLILTLFLTACGEGGGGDEGDGKVLLVWAHSGQVGERETLQSQVERFNRLGHGIKVEINLIPEGSYNAQVQAAAVAGGLPDLLEFDGPFLYNYVWQGHLRPLESLLKEETRRELLPSIVAQGTYNEKLYSVGTFDSGLGLYARRSMLEAAGVRIPTGPSDAWSADEFDALLAALAEHDEDGAVLDLKLNYAGEWYTYAFSPIIQSAGGDLIGRDGFKSAKGVLNGPAAVGAMSRLQNWLSAGRVEPNLDDAAFIQGRVALCWSGHWEYGRFAEALGDDLLLLPLPDFGSGTRTGQGSWNWGITRNAKAPEAAAKFLEFLLERDEVLAMAAANGAVPGTLSALAGSELYAEGGPLRLFAVQLTGGYAVPRPETPTYPVITSAFQQAFEDIRNGVDLQRALDRAVNAIDRDIEDNRGYPPVMQ